MDLVYSIILFYPPPLYIFVPIFLYFLNFLYLVWLAHIFFQQKLTETASSLQSCKNLAVVIGPRPTATSVSCAGWLLLLSRGRAGCSSQETRTCVVRHVYTSNTDSDRDRGRRSSRRTTNLRLVLAIYLSASGLSRNPLARLQCSYSSICHSVHWLSLRNEDSTPFCT